MADSSGFSYDPTLALDMINSGDLGSVWASDPSLYSGPSSAASDPTQFFYQPTPADQLNNDSWANQQFGNPAAYGLTTGDLGIGPTGVQSSGSGGFSLASLLNGLGIGKNAGMGNLLGLGALVPLLATLGGGLLARNATNTAMQDITNAYNTANQKITGILGPSNQTFAPYMSLGQLATQGLANLGTQPLAQNFRPLGSGRGITLGNLGGH